MSRFFSEFIPSFFIYTILFSLFFVSNITTNAQKKSAQSLKKVVLDAGHGGKDAGAAAYKLGKHEKDINLDVVLKLGQILKDSLPNLQVVYTRTTDDFVELKQRHRIANDANADLFISIHVNATAVKRRRVKSGNRYRTVIDRSTKAQGTETYVLGLHRNNQKSRAIEEYGDQIAEEPGLLDPTDPTSQILVAQYTQAFLSRSINFADKVQQNFVKVGRNSFGVKQMGLEVLAGSAMPGALVELGFINNVEEEQYLNSEKGQNELAMSIFKAIKAYKIDLEKGSSN